MVIVRIFNNSCIANMLFKVFIGNPIEEEAGSYAKYTEEVTKRLLFLKKLDGYPLIRDFVQVCTFIVKV